jgi:putative spermidine/putrescine transport system substrate-binding protein
MKSIAIIAAAAALSLLSGTVSAQQSLTIAGAGGAGTYAASQSQHKPFESKTGIKITTEDFDGSLGVMAAQVRSGNVKWDLALVDKPEAIKGCEEGIFEKIDSSKLPAGDDGTPAAKDFIPGGILPCGVGNVTYTNAIAYDIAKLGANGPKSLNDFFDTKKFPGKRGLRKDPVAAMEWALIADGVPMADVYKVLATPAGVDRAFKKLDTIKKDIVWWTAGSQSVQLLASGEVVMIHAWNGRIVAANLKENKNFGIMWDAQLQATDYYVILQGSKNSAAANEFVRFATSTKPLADETNYIPYSPSRKSSMAKIPDSNPNKVWLPAAQQGRSMTVDASFWMEHGDDLSKRFQTWLAK